MQLWTYEHATTLIPAVMGMLIVAMVLRLVIGNKPLRIRMIPIQVIAVLIVLLEVGKQAVSLSRGYDLYHLPFHFCSLFIFMLPIMAFYRGKYQQRIYGITASLCTAVLLLMLIYPALIYGDWDVRQFFTHYLSFHTVLFHNLVLFACILVIALQVHTPAKGEQRSVIWFIIGFCVISATMAQLLKTNFNNFYSCNIPPLENLRLSIQASLGYGVTQALYILIVTVLDIGFVLGAYWLYRGLRCLCTGKQKAAA